MQSHHLTARKEGLCGLQFVFFNIYVYIYIYFFFHKLSQYKAEISKQQEGICLYFKMYCIRPVCV